MSPLEDGPVERRLRARLVRDHLRGCADERVVAAMARLPRHLFLPADARAHAYVDAPVPIGAGQTISQPSLIAHMLALLQLRPGLRVLDVGAGSGYVSALLAILVAPGGAVFARERQGSLARRTAPLLAALAGDDWAALHYEHGDALAGWAEQAPFDAIHVGAAFPGARSALQEQLRPGGRLVQPVTAGGGQVLQLVERGLDGTWSEREDWPVRFVPMVDGLCD